MASASELTDRISKIEKSSLDPEIQKLIDDMQGMLKRSAAESSNAVVETAVPASAEAETKKPKKAPKKPKKELKVAKGARDFDPRKMVLRQKVFDEITRVFRNHGGETIDTPVFELRQLLMGNYGEDQKLIYNLEDQGGEILSLRYDLTVPFARYVGMNKIEQMKRYHIAKVYRRDQPAIERGRFREFYQCDFDIVGTYEPMSSDAEVLKIVKEIVSSPVLDLGEFSIKLSDRKILEGLLTACGVKPDQIRPASSAIDKLDKAPWEEVRKEMVECKNIPEEVADMIGEYVVFNGTLNNDIVEESDAYKLVEKLQNDEKLKSKKNKQLEEGLSDMKKLLTFCSYFGIGKELSFDLSLARGLDYYTGPIFETVLTGKNVGSITGGGRYDKMVSEFTNSKRLTPCVGTSFGIERIMTIVEKQHENLNVKTAATKCLVISPMKGTLPDRVKLLSKLLDNDIAAETVQKNNVKMLTQLQMCENKKIPIAVVVAKDEIEKGVVKLRHIETRKEWEVPNEKMVEEVIAALEKDERGEFVVEEGDEN